MSYDKLDRFTRAFLECALMVIFRRANVRSDEAAQPVVSKPCRSTDGEVERRFGRQTVITERFSLGSLEA